MTIISNIFDFIFNIFDWFWEKWHKFTAWFLENQRRNLLIIFSIFFSIAALVTITVSIIPRPSNLPSTPLNTPVTFGTLNKSASLTQSNFNPKNGVLSLHFQIIDGTQADKSFVDINKISFTAYTDHGGEKVTGSYIPTSTNTVVVLFKNLSHNFNAVTVTAHDKSVNTATVEAPSSISSSSSSTTKFDKSKEAQSGKFIINRDKVTYSTSLNVNSQKALAVQEYHEKIRDQESVISKNKKAISQYQKAITQQEESIKNYERQQADSPNADIKTNVENSRNAITQIRTQIGEAEQNINVSKSKISEYHLTIEKLESGYSTLPKATKM
ncbi:hypothetical protein [Leuconostoc citreum]|uniref:hypothetical protein n=1 Tax=Leuconostoc citreum TaxID=33964 RepID=UPI0032DE9BFB